MELSSGGRRARARRSGRVAALIGVAAFAVAILGYAAPALALPELGRCGPDTGKGAFTRSNCLAMSKTHTGGFEWEAGPGASKGFKAIQTGFRLETTGAI